MTGPVDVLAGYVSLSWLRAEAAVLRSDAGENTEYDRALDELLSNACPEPAVAELVEDSRNAARSLSAAATALEVCRVHVPAEEWARLHLDFTAGQLARDAATVRAALAKFGVR